MSTTTPERRASLLAQLRSRLSLSSTLPSCSSLSTLLPLAISSPSCSPKLFPNSGTGRLQSVVQLSNGSTPPHVVIIGGGYAGSLLARGLEDAVKNGSIRLTVIERKTFMHHKIASFRTCVHADEAHMNRSHIPLQDIIRYGRIVIGDVVEVCESTKSIRFSDSNQSSITYDILVAATGSMNLSPGDMPPNVRTQQEATEHFRSTAKAIENSNDILLVGGGPSAIELAGEIRSRYEDKQITLITASGSLLSACVSAVSPRLVTRLRDKLEMLNVRVIFGERVIAPSREDYVEHKFRRNVVVVTEGSLNMNKRFDLVVWSGPLRIHTDIYPLGWINELGELNVDSSFRVKTRTDVFALGDVTSIPETKQAITIPSKVPFIVHNIQVTAGALSQGNLGFGPLRGIRRYKFRTRAIIYLPLGPNHGVSQLHSGLVYGDAKTSKWKGKDLFCTYFYRMLTGGKMPPFISRDSLENPRFSMSNETFGEIQRQSLTDIERDLQQQALNGESERKEDSSLCIV